MDYVIFNQCVGACGKTTSASYQAIVLIIIIVFPRILVQNYTDISVRNTEHNFTRLEALNYNARTCEDYMSHAFSLIDYASPSFLIAYMPEIYTIAKVEGPPHFHGIR